MDALVGPFFIFIFLQRLLLSIVSFRLHNFKCNEVIVECLGLSVQERPCLPVLLTLLKLAFESQIHVLIGRLLLEILLGSV